MNILYVALGGFLGALCRVAISYAMPFDGGFPIATFIVNCAGSIGFALFLRTSLSKSPALHLFATTGFFGSFTTFSAFSYETVMLIQQNEWLLSFIYVCSTVLVSFGAVFAVFHSQNRRSAT